VALDEDVAQALALAQRRARELGAPLVVAGSLILVGEVRRLLMGVS
jgi:folylpolyglutamate synthase/dihydropteroate synthase